MLELTIIVPVYQVEPYIRPCIESIYKQGLADSRFEVIIVNDGTKDRSMEMIADIIDQHQNITIINQENQGLSVVRNNGIAVAKGEYILMPDSDDLLVEGALPPLLDKALETKADLVVADFLEMTDEEIDAEKSVTQPTPQMTEKNGHQLMLEDLNPYQCYVWRTLFRTEFLHQNKLSFVPGVCYQDVPFTHECYLRAEKCIRTNWLLNIYRRGHESATFSFSTKKGRDFCIVIGKTWKLTTTSNLPLPIRHKLEDDIYTSFNILYYSLLHSIKAADDRKAIVNYLSKLAPNFKLTHGIRQKVETSVFRLSPRLHLALRQLHWKWVTRHKSTDR